MTEPTDTPDSPKTTEVEDYRTVLQRESCEQSGHPPTGLTRDEDTYRVIEAQCLCGAARFTLVGDDDGA
jgi:hypothetical protein